MSYINFIYYQTELKDTVYKSLIVTIRQIIFRSSLSKLFLSVKKIQVYTIAATQTIKTQLSTAEDSNSPPDTLYCIIKLNFHTNQNSTLN